MTKFELIRSESHNRNGSKGLTYPTCSPENGLFWANNQVGNIYK